MIAIDPLFAASGFIVGLIIGLTGVGGGSLMTPLLILLFGIHPATAVGTDLLFASVTKGVGSAVHGYTRNVEWKIVGWLAAGSVPSAAATLLISDRLYLDSDFGAALISRVIALALFITALALFFRSWIEKRFGQSLAGIAPASTRRLTVAMGVVLGVLVSLSSVGAGAIGVVALMLLYPRLPVARIVASDIAHAVPLTLIAGVGHWIAGLTDASILVSLLAGSIPAVVAGSYIAPRVPDRALRYLLAGTLLFTGSRLAL